MRFTDYTLQRTWSGRLRCHVRTCPCNRLGHTMTQPDLAGTRAEDGAGHPRGRDTRRCAKTPTYRAPRHRTRVLSNNARYQCIRGVLVAISLATAALPVDRLLTWLGRCRPYARLQVVQIRVFVIATIEQIVHDGHELKVEDQ